MITRRNIILLIVLAFIGGVIFYLNSIQAKHSSSSASKNAGIKPSITAMHKEEKAKKYPRAKELVGISGFINTPPFTLADLIGKKVILVDFWTYSCINCQRALPYVNQWYDKYRDKGLAIIGVHTPEFDFEKKYENVAAAVQRYGIKYPVVLDNDYGTWSAYGNKYWPREYLIDIDGFIVHDHIGEGGYDETEVKIQELLNERMMAEQQGTVPPQPSTTPFGTPDIDFSKVRSPEIYFGSARNQYLGNGTKNADGSQILVLPKSTTANTLYLTGTWKFEKELATSESARAKIIFRYQAKNVYFVAGSTTGVRIKVVKDGKPLGVEAGRDVGTDGTALIKENRLYELIKGSSYGEHGIEIQVQSPGLQAFTLTFG